MPRRAQSGRRTSFGIRVGFIESYIFVTLCLCIYLYLRYKVCSYLVKQTESYSTKRKENNQHFPPEIIFVLCDHTIHCLARTALLLACQRQCSNYFAANRLSCSKVSVSNGFPESKLTTKFKMDGPEPPATDTRNRSLCCTNSVRLHLVMTASVV